MSERPSSGSVEQLGQVVAGIDTRTAQDIAMAIILDALMRQLGRSEQTKTQCETAASRSWR